MDPQICPECGDWLHTCPCPARAVKELVEPRCMVEEFDRPPGAPTEEQEQAFLERHAKDRPRGITVCKHHVRADEYCGSCVFDDAMAAKDRREGKNPGRDQVNYQRPKLGDWLIVIEPSPLKYTVLPVASKEQAVAIAQSMKPESNPAIYRREDIRITRGISMSAKVIGEGVDDA